MRNYEHLIGNNKGILLPDKKSAKAKYGLNSGEYLDSSDKDFLREGTSTITHRPLFQLTHPSTPIGEFNGKSYGEGVIIAEIQDASDGYHEGGINEKKVVWKK